MKRFALVLAILVTTSALACLWDSDTLAEEAANKMDIVRITTGRFIRNPPLYYQMRLDRVSNELAVDPSKLDDYDDASVACDRLGNDEQAIKWIEKKKAYMVAHGLTRTTNKDDWYRYYANAGTFHAHLWFRRGAKKDDLKEIALGRDLIAKAIEINPESHFGRERSQLEVLKWLADGAKTSLAEHFESRSQEQGERADAEKDARGLAGLVNLGNGWESVDLFLALQNRLSSGRDASLAELALLRAQELLDKGVKPLVKVDENSFGYAYMQPDDTLAAFNKGEFTRLRKEADTWHAKRTEFLLAGLKAGRHPDTDTHFWDGYREADAPKIQEQPYLTTYSARTTLGIALVLGIVLVFVITTILVLIWLIRKIRKRRATTA
jgi:hypothetical protein